MYIVYRQRSKRDDEAAGRPPLPLRGCQGVGEGMEAMSNMRLPIRTSLYPVCWGHCMCTIILIIITAERTNCVWRRNWRVATSLAPVRFPRIRASRRGGHDVFLSLSSSKTTGPQPTATPTDRRLLSRYFQPIEEESSNINLQFLNDTRTRVYYVHIYIYETCSKNTQIKILTEKHL